LVLRLSAGPNKNINRETQYQPESGPSKERIQSEEVD